MNTKQLFFFSLIILSIAMGFNWFKNRPKTVVRKVPQQTRQAVNHDEVKSKIEKEDEVKEEKEKDEEEDDDDIDEELKSRNRKYEGEIHDNDNNEEEIAKIKDNDKSDDKENLNENDNSNSEKETNENTTVIPLQTIASDSSTLKASDTQNLVVDNPLRDDPILKEYFQITKNPFEESPYSKLVQKIKQEEQKIAQPVVVEKKEVKIPKIFGNARFTGTIETERGLKAIVDGSLYEKGNDFNGYIVKGIQKNVIFLVLGKDDYLLPKTGVQIDINQQTGEYSITDTFE